MLLRFMNKADHFLFEFESLIFRFYRFTTKLNNNCNLIEEYHHLLSQYK